ncbi:unnamed protein product [Rotaria sordida]|uniref:Uncharacterized protein n=1 Tax=Rotaria sordida TaxID=392033 RepID=A0A816BY66_9BILA|nr:unnamed protein product [Rotaria sordida]CAF1615515.1 unnamed protein product [Rotaria sordida]
MLNLIETGLNECTLIGERGDIENEINLNENKDIVFERNDDKQIDFDNIKLKPLKITTTLITNKLTDTFNRLTSSSSISITINNINNNYSIDQYQFSYDLFKKNNLLHLYISIYSLDIINNRNINSYLISRNVQFEEEIHRLFKIYLLSLLCVARTLNDEAINNFNRLFVKSFQSTDAFHLWQSKGPYLYIDEILSRHPQAGQLNVTDVKLRFAQYVFIYLFPKIKYCFKSVLDDIETGRKLKGAFEDTSQFMSEKFRAATKVPGQAKNSIFTSVIATFNQGKQWLSKGQSLSKAIDTLEDPGSSILSYHS